MQAWARETQGKGVHGNPRRGSPSWLNWDALKDSRLRTLRGALKLQGEWKSSILIKAIGQQLPL